LKDFPDADIDVSIIWIPMLPSDNAAAARKTAQMFDDPRVTQFCDADRKAGRAFAHDLIAPGRGPAWDIYLSYNPGDTWREHPPRPSDYFHQLGGGRRADAKRFRTGDKLIAALHATMEASGAAK